MRPAPPLPIATTSCSNITAGFVTEVLQPRVRELVHVIVYLERAGRVGQEAVDLHRRVYAIRGGHPGATVPGLLAVPEAGLHAADPVARHAALLVHIHFCVKQREHEEEEIERHDGAHDL
eukprot:scaffold1806_cov240-Pinguiococcus_pyrenoidosus.AAC.1